MIQIPMTPAQFDNARTELAEKGITTGGEQGVISAKGVTANYSYDGATLTVDVTHAPFGMVGKAESEIKATLEASLSG